MAFIRSDKLYAALEQAGIFNEKDSSSVRRVVIDMTVGEVTRLYVERIGETPLLEVLPQYLVDATETNLESLKKEAADIESRISGAQWQLESLYRQLAENAETTNPVP